MGTEVILKKSDNQYFAFIPEYGIIETSASAEEAFEKAQARRSGIDAAFSAAGARHLLERNHHEGLVVRTWSGRFKKAIILSVVLYLLGLAALGLTIHNSIKRGAASLHKNIELLQTPSEQKLERFRKLLQDYRPFLEEWRKANEEPKK